MDYKEFLVLVRKLKESRKHEITGSLGVYDSYKWIRKNKWLDIGTNLSEGLFYSIIRKVNKKLAELLALGYDVKLPYKLGVLEIRKAPVILKIKDGKLFTNMPIDWDATVKLWYEDEEAFNNKTIVRKEAKENYRIRYNKNSACYNNKSFFEFHPNRVLKQNLKRNIELNKVEAFLAYG